MKMSQQEKYIILSRESEVDIINEKGHTDDERTEKIRRGQDVLPTG